MGAFTVYGRKRLMDSLFVAVDQVGDLWIALTLVVPGTSNDASRLVEPVGGAYARAAYPQSNGWTPSPTGEVFNAASFTFPVPNATWGTVRGWAAVTTASGDGNVLMSGPLRQPVTIQLGATAPVVDIGALRATLR